MSSAGASTHSVFLGARRIGYAPAGTPVRWTEVTDVKQAVGGLLEEVGEQSTGKRKSAQVWLSGALARPFLIGPVSGLGSWHEAERLAVSLAPQLTGLSSPCEVWLDDDPSDEPAIGVAVEQSIFLALQGAAEPNGVRIVSVRPWWSMALEGVWNDVRDARMVAFDDGEALTLLRHGVSGWEEPSTCWPRPDDEQVSSFLLRQAAGADLPLDLCRLVAMGLSDVPEPGADFLPRVIDLEKST